MAEITIRISSLADSDTGAAGDPIRYGGWSGDISVNGILAESFADQCYLEDATGVSLNAVYRALGGLHLNDPSVPGERTRWAPGPAPHQVTVFLTDTEVAAGLNDYRVMWRSRDWQDSAGQPIPHADTWKRIDTLVGDLAALGYTTRFRLTGPHVQDPHGLRVDALAALRMNLAPAMTGGMEHPSNFPYLPPEGLSRADRNGSGLPSGAHVALANPITDRAIRLIAEDVYARHLRGEADPQPDAAQLRLVLHLFGLSSRDFPSSPHRSAGEALAERVMMVVRARTKSADPATGQSS